MHIFIIAPAVTSKPAAAVLFHLPGIKAKEKQFAITAAIPKRLLRLALNADRLKPITGVSAPK